MADLLSGKVALVTGGAQGLGESICWRLANEGCCVVVADLNEPGAFETARAINAPKAPVEWWTAGVTPSTTTTPHAAGPQ